MLERRRLLGSLLAAPFVIRLFGLNQSVSSPVLVDDIKWITSTMDYGYFTGVCGEYRGAGDIVLRHAMAVSDLSPENIDRAKSVITEHIDFMLANPDWRPYVPPPKSSRYVSKGIQRVHAARRSHWVRYVDRGVPSHA